MTIQEAVGLRVKLKAKLVQNRKPFVYDFVIVDGCNILFEEFIYMPASALSTNMRIDQPWPRTLYGHGKELIPLALITDD